MEQFGATPSIDHVPFTGYAGGDYSIEPDASAASYFFAAAAITGGRVTVEGLGTDSLQGDVAFVDLLERMGASVERARSSITVRGTGSLHGIDVDLCDLSDLADASPPSPCSPRGPTTITGVGFIRGKESDRIGDLITELRRCGVYGAWLMRDGFTIGQRPVRHAIRTYHDHWMAMAFVSFIGCERYHIEIEDPDCVSKTFAWTFEAPDQSLQRSV